MHAFHKASLMAASIHHLHLYYLLATLSKVLSALHGATPPTQPPANLLPRAAIKEQSQDRSRAAAAPFDDVCVLV